jgi:hypothetical protein
LNLEMKICFVPKNKMAYPDMKQKS